MGTYNLPRNVKGEGRILFIFSTKALIYTLVGAVIGFPFYYILGLINLRMIGIVIMAALSIIGFIIATVKVPESSAYKITKYTGGENIDDIIIRWVKFKRTKNKIYIYQEDKTKKVEKEVKEK